MVNSKLKIKKHKFSTRELREQHNLKKREQHTLQIKRDALRRHLYCGETITQLTKSFNVSTSTVATWKKNASKILDSVGKPSYNQVRLRGSKYQDVELALLYWLKDMRSKDVPPPITLTLLRAKAEKYNFYIQYLMLCPILLISTFCWPSVDTLRWHLHVF